MAENSKIEWTDRVCELEDELAAVRAELERAMRVVNAARCVKHHSPAISELIFALEGAVKEWEAGR